jgi:WD40 repeat protein
MGNGEIANKFEGHFDKVTQLGFLDKKLISSSLDGTIRTWNYETA